MIDLHSHILPGIDDGAQNKEDTLSMARAAVVEGITHIAGTPHHHNGKYNNETEAILKNVKRVNQWLKEENISLTVLPGQEIRLYGDLMKDLTAKKLLPVNKSKFLLVEFPSSQVPRYAKEMLYNIQLEGFTPIIVHPERNKVFMEKPELLYRFVQNGAMTQLTAASLVGNFGKNIQKFSRSLVEANLTHILASDAHNTTSRGFAMKKAFEYLETEFEKGFAEQYAGNAERIMLNEHPILEQPRELKINSFWGNLFKK